MPIRRALSIIAALSLVSAALARQDAPSPPKVEKSVIMKQSSPYWLDIRLKARSMLVDPADCVLNEVMDSDFPMGVASPDGMRVAFIGSDPDRVKAGHDFDLFVANVDASQPSGKSNVRRITTDQKQPVEPHWLPDSRSIVFLAGEKAAQQVWYVDASGESRPLRITDGTHRCYDLSITPSGDIAYVVHKGSKKKEQYKDLVIRSAPTPQGRLEKPNVRTPLQDQHISSYAISPDGKTLAWSGLGSMFLLNLETGESREIPLQGVHRQLLNHTVEAFAWRPDGKVIAIQCGFLGGIARAMDTDPNEPWPRMFAEDKVFFVPVAWKPALESLEVTNENFPSPTADDPKAEISPPAGDESKPWWVRDVPMRALWLSWIAASEANDRIEKHAVPPGQESKPEPTRTFPPLPKTPPAVKPG